MSKVMSKESKLVLWAWAKELNGARLSVRVPSQDGQLQTMHTTSDRRKIELRLKMQKSSLKNDSPDRIELCVDDDLCDSKNIMGNVRTRLKERGDKIWKQAEIRVDISDCVNEIVGLTRSMEKRQETEAAKIAEKLPSECSLRFTGPSQAGANGGTVQDPVRDKMFGVIHPNSNAHDPRQVQAAFSQEPDVARCIPNGEQVPVSVQELQLRLAHEKQMVPLNALATLLDAAKPAPNMVSEDMILKLMSAEWQRSAPQDHQALQSLQQEFKDFKEAAQKDAKDTAAKFDTLMGMMEKLIHSQLLDERSKTQAENDVRAYEAKLRPALAAQNEDLVESLKTELSTFRKEIVDTRIQNGKVKRDQAELEKKFTENSEALSKQQEDLNARLQSKDEQISKLLEFNKELQKRLSDESAHREDATEGFQKHMLALREELENKFTEDLNARLQSKAEQISKLLEFNEELQKRLSDESALSKKQEEVSAGLQRDIQAVQGNLEAHFKTHVEEVSAGLRHDIQTAQRGLEARIKTHFEEASVPLREQIQILERALQAHIQDNEDVRAELRGQIQTVQGDLKLRVQRIEEGSAGLRDQIQIVQRTVWAHVEGVETRVREQIRTVQGSLEAHIQRSEEQIQTVQGGLEARIQCSEEQIRTVQGGLEAHIQRSEEQIRTVQGGLEAQIQRSEEQIRTVQGGLEAHIQRSEEQIRSVQGGLEAHIQRSEEQTRTVQGGLEARFQGLQFELAGRMGHFEDEQNFLRRELDQLRERRSPEGLWRALRLDVDRLLAFRRDEEAAASRWAIENQPDSDSSESGDSDADSVNDPGSSRASTSAGSVVSAASDISDSAESVQMDNGSGSQAAVNRHLFREVARVEATLQDIMATINYVLNMLHREHREGTIIQMLPRPEEHRLLEVRQRPPDSQPENEPN